MIMNMMMIPDCVNYDTTVYALMKLKSVKKAAQNKNCYLIFDEQPFRRKTNLISYGLSRWSDG